jgi:Flp pilus assembly protein TadG
MKESKIMIITARPHLYRRTARRGTVVAMLAISLVALLGFLALAIDIGMLATAKTQAQAAADLSSLTAARTLNGDGGSSYNNAQATTNAQNILTYNRILGGSIPSSQLTLSYGSYDYNQVSQTFSVNFPATAGRPFSATNSSVTTSNLPAGFSKIFGAQFLPNVTATAQAVYRPRDIALIMDLSGSMRFGTVLGYDFYTSSRTTNNPDTLVPAFSHYSSGSAGMIGPSTNRTSGTDNYTISPTNTTAPNASYTLTYVNNFYSNAAYATPLIRAFDSYTSTDGGDTWVPGAGQPQLPPNSYATVPGGDVPLFRLNSTTNYTQSVNQLVGGTTTNIFWELDGYSAYNAGSLDTLGTGGSPRIWNLADYSTPGTQFNGYTQGPGYYGKTFFIWPPDPRAGAVSAANLPSYLTLLGLVNAADQAFLSANWTVWLAQGPTTGLTNLQNWLKGATTSGGPYSPTTGPYVPGSASRAPIYYAVCRLFNRAYPAGTAAGTFVADWRVRFFGTNNNTVLFNSSGSLNPPGSAGMSTATQTYNAILSWIASTPNPFPSQLRAGRVKYYGAIPTQVTGVYPSFGSTDQRFWVEFINNVLGYYQNGATSYQDVSSQVGYGSDFTWGTVSRNNPPASVTQYMNYNDIPLRPRLRHWFGPLNLVDSIHNYNLSINIGPYYLKQPGDSYEAPIYTGKQAYLAAVDTLKQNHANDNFSMICYSWPKDSATAVDSQRFNSVMSPLGANYDYAKAAILFPFSTINADGSCNNTEVTPYDVGATGLIPSDNFSAIPRGNGNTSFAMALMLAYNQFALTPSTDTTLRTFVTSTPITFPNGMAGGLGRKGAQKVVIFETDGLANTQASATLVNAGTYKYYAIRYDMNRPNSSEYPSLNATGINNTTTLNQVYSLVQQLSTDYSTSRNPFRLYSLGFGPVFNGPNAASALLTLQTMQYYGGTQTNPNTPLDPSQIITGTDAQMLTNMINTFTNLMNSGVQIALIR